MFILVAVLFLYALILIFMGFVFQLQVKPVFFKDQDLSATVLVPFRNEEKNLPEIIECLNNQSFSNFEVIFINDHSSDKSLQVLDETLPKNLLNARFINLTTSKGKKAAIAKGIEEAQYELIVTTDADCHMNLKWLSNMFAPFYKEEIQMVLGPVMLTGNPHWKLIQSLEFTPLIGITALAAQLGNPIMANGANLAYRKSAFEQVGGFDGINETPSGDDELLMNKFRKMFKKGVVFNPSNQALVTTEAFSDWRSFLNQRLRWASKWNIGARPVTMALAVFVFLFHLLQLMGLVSVFLIPEMSKWWIYALSLKLISEYVFIHSVRNRFNFKTPIIPFLLCFILYPFYAIYFGIAANFKKFEWKGRKYPSSAG